MAAADDIVHIVRLVPEAGRRRPTGGAERGRLQAVSASQSHPIRAGTDLSGEPTVLVRCRAVADAVAAATTRPA